MADNGVNVITDTDTGDTTTTTGNTSTDISLPNSTMSHNGDTHAATHEHNTSPVNHILSDVHAYEHKLHTLISQRHGVDTAGAGATETDATLQKLRRALKDRYMKLLQLDIQLCDTHDIEQQLWRNIYYQSIHECKQAVKASLNGDKTAADTQIHAYKQYLNDCTTQYKALLDQQCVHAKLRITNDGIHDDIITGVSPATELSEQQCGMMVCSVKIVYRCLIRLGDIERYRQLVDTEFNTATTSTLPTNTTSAVSVGNKQVVLLQRQPADKWRQCERYYVLAKLLLPHNGNSYNQLAVVATYKHDLIYATYRYIRAIACSHSFPTAQINLKRLLETRCHTQLLALLNAPIPGCTDTNVCHHTPQTTQCKCAAICDAANGYADIEKLFILLTAHLLGYVTVNTYFSCLLQCTMYVLKQTMQIPANDKNNLHSLPLRLICIIVQALQIQSQSSTTQGHPINTTLKQQCLLTLFELTATLASVGTTLTSIQSSLYLFCQYLNSNRQLVSKQHHDCVGHAQTRWWTGFAALLQIYSRNNKVKSDVGTANSKHGQLTLAEEVEVCGYTWFQRLIEKRYVLKVDVTGRRQQPACDMTMFTSTLIGAAANESDASQRRIASFFSFASYVARDTAMLHKDKRTGRFVAKARTGSGDSKRGNAGNSNGGGRHVTQPGGARIVNVPLRPPPTHAATAPVPHQYSRQPVATAPYNQQPVVQPAQQRVSRSTVDVTTPTHNTGVSLLQRSSAISPTTEQSRNVFLSATAKPFVPMSVRGVSTSSGYSSTQQYSHDSITPQPYSADSSAQQYSNDSTGFDAGAYAAQDMDSYSTNHHYIDSDYDLQPGDDLNASNSTNVYDTGSQPNSGDDLILQQGGWSAMNQFTADNMMSYPFRHSDSADDGWNDWDQQQQAAVLDDAFTGLSMSGGDVSKKPGDRRMGESRFMKSFFQPEQDDHSSDLTANHQNGQSVGS